ncbi:MAG: sugar phosphate isomerase/epimerase [Verrucomicrobia bacterium]|nr:sugar phosphate isomerase/epimerase [Verrucomicrobiota bacterium]
MFPKCFAPRVKASCRVLSAWTVLNVATLMTFMVSAGLVRAQALVYTQNFDQTASGQTPDDFLVLGGRFAVEDQTLVLPGAPLDNHGAVFGPDNQGDLEIRARIRSEKKGRLYPSFGVGLYGLGGYSLKVSPAKKALELYRGRSILTEVPFDWRSAGWVNLRLAVTQDAPSAWMIVGKAWMEGSDEPQDWQIRQASSQAPTQGKASLWGQPFSGRPIEYDDLVLLKPVGAEAKAEGGFSLGLQTWTLRNMDFDQMVAFAKEHGLTKIQSTDKHLNPRADWEDIKRKKAILDAEGLEVYTFGVAGTSMDHAENRRLFEFAQFMGIQLIIVEPRDFAIFDSLERLVKEFDIKIAIHNHGLTSLYGNPMVVKNVIQHRDPRIGVCLDIGWITAAGFDAEKVYRGYDGRVFDFHLKDKKVEVADRRLVGISAHIGEGDANLEGLFAALKETGYQGVLAIETDSPLFAREPSGFVQHAKEVFQKLSQP